MRSRSRCQPSRLSLILTAAIVAGAILAGCGGSTKTVTVIRTRVATRTVTVSATSTSTHTASASSGASILASPTQCDANISVLNGGCVFADNTFWEFWSAQGATSTMAVYDPHSGTPVGVACAGTTEITCKAQNGAIVRFPQQAVADYTQSQASAYAASGKLGPHSSHTTTGSSTQSSATGASSATSSGSST